MKRNTSFASCFHRIRPVQWRREMNRFCLDRKMILIGIGWILWLLSSQLQYHNNLMLLFWTHTHTEYIRNYSSDTNKICFNECEELYTIQLPQHLIILYGHFIRRYIEKSDFVGCVCVLVLLIKTHNIRCR